MKMPHDDDAVWRALANPLRRAILDVLRTGPRTTSELVEALETSRHVVMQHLGVLREADLVLVELLNHFCERGEYWRRTLVSLVTTITDSVGMVVEPQTRELF